MRFSSMARVAALTCVAGLFVSLTSCTIPGTDTMGAMRNSSERVAVDNAIYDTLAEMYGKDRITLVPAQRKYHRWAATSNEWATGTDRMRTRVEAGAWLGSDGVWAPDIKVSNELSQQQSPFGNTAPNSLGSDPWLEAGRNTKVEAEIANKVNAKIRSWRANGSQEGGNRRDEWLDRTSGGGR